MNADPNAPILIRGRRHARDVLADAERVCREDGTLNNASMISLAIQFVTSAAITDGATEEDAFNGLAGSVLWAVNKLAPEARLAVFEAFAAGLRERIALAPELAN